jgi:acyl-ACP thioesterase
MFFRRDFTCFRDVKPAFSDYDWNGNLKLSAILRFTSDLAGEDYAERGLSWEVLQAHGIVFLVSRMALRVHRNIRDGETVTIATYERSVEGPYCIRNYYVIGESGDTAVSAKSAWIVCEPASRRILRPSELPKPIECHPDADVDCAEPNRIHLPHTMEYAGDRLVVYSDIDANGHVNNSKYADIACDYLPPELLQKPVRDFAAVFRQEAKPGEIIRVGRSVGGGSAVVSGDVGSVSCFECKFGWGC